MEAAIILARHCSLCRGVGHSSSACDSARADDLRELANTVVSIKDLRAVTKHMSRSELAVFFSIRKQLYQVLDDKKKSIKIVQYSFAQVCHSWNKDSNEAYTFDNGYVRYDEVRGQLNPHGRLDHFGRNSFLLYRSRGNQSLNMSLMMGHLEELMFLDGSLVPLAVLVKLGTTTRLVARLILWFLWQIKNTTVSPMDISRRFDYLVFKREFSEENTVCLRRV